MVRICGLHVHAEPLGSVIGGVAGHHCVYALRSTFKFANRTCPFCGGARCGFQAPSLTLFKEESIMRQLSIVGFCHVPITDSEPDNSPTRILTPASETLTSDPLSIDGQAQLQEVRSLLADLHEPQKPNLLAASQQTWDMRASQVAPSCHSWVCHFASIRLQPAAELWNVHRDCRLSYLHLAADSALSGPQTQSLERVSLHSRQEAAVIERRGHASGPWSGQHQPPESLSLRVGGTRIASQRVHSSTAGRPSAIARPSWAWRRPRASPSSNPVGRPETLKPCLVNGGQACPFDPRVA